MLVKAKLKLFLFAASMLSLLLFFNANSTAQNNQEYEPFYVSISINAVEHGGIYPAIAKNGEFYLEAQTYQIMGLNIPEAELVNYRGRGYLALTALIGVDYSFNLASQSLEITCPASCFPASELIRVYEHLVPSKTPFGFYLNYDLSYETSGSGNFFGSLFELGVFSDYGSGNLTYSLRDNDDTTEFIRLDTNWTIDFVEKNLKLNLGDGITSYGGWGRALRFGGIQFGTDFGLQPGFVSFPTPIISGGASLPSTAEIFVNGIRRANINLDPGAFTIEQPPIITGSGDLKVVINDILGRETVITQPFYASRNLLKKNLSEYSLEAGFLRNNYGRLSNDYSQAFITSTYRKGLSQTLTAGFRGEVSSQTSGFGPFIDWQLPIGGVLSSAAAVSFSDGSSGQLFQLNYSWEKQSLGINISNEWISENFTRLGSTSLTLEPKMRTNASVGLDISDNSSLSVSYSKVDEWQDDDFEMVSANYALQLDNLGSLNVNFSQSFGHYKNTAVFLIFTARLGSRTTASTSLDRNNGQWRSTVQANTNTPTDGGFGLRGEATLSGDDRKRAGFTYNSQKALFNADYSHIKGNDALRLGLRGGLVFLGGEVIFSNPINDSFALVKVSNFENVGVLRDNRLVTKTNSKGTAFISRLRPYEENRISINPLDLPLSAEIGRITLKPIPRRNSGLVVEFPVKQSVVAMAKIVDENGDALPTGSYLQVVNDQKVFPVGFGGAVYLSGLEEEMNLKGQTVDGVCYIKIAALAPSPFPKRLGTLVCQGE